MDTQITSTALGHRYCGRTFTESDLATIRRIIASPQKHPTRAAIARAMCSALGWFKLDGLPKLMSARVALLRMQEDGLLSMPAPTHSYTPARGTVFTAASDPQMEMRCSSSALVNLTLHRVITPGDSRLWNELVARHHYLGYRPLPGAQIRYFVTHENRLLAANWLYAGQTAGRGKLDRNHRQNVPVKDVYLYPLHRHFKKILTKSGIH